MKKLFLVLIKTSFNGTFIILSFTSFNSISKILINVPGKKFDRNVNSEKLDACSKLIT